MDIIKKQKTIEHPLEEVFDIENNSTVVEYSETLPTPPVDAPIYDEKDNEIDLQFEEVYVSAMNKVIGISDEIERVEGKYKARLGEVTATMLTVALNAAKEKRELKQHKDKLLLQKQVSGPSTVNNNLVITDRNEILKLLQEGKNLKSDKL
jgi:hypothetical protein